MVYGLKNQLKKWDYQIDYQPLNLFLQGNIIFKGLMNKNNKYFLIIARIYFDKKAEYLIEDPDHLKVHFQFIEMDKKENN